MRHKVLITGVTGFVGGWLASSLPREQYEVVGYSRKSVEADYQIIVGASLTDKETLDLALAGTQTVVHAAAMAEVDERDQSSVMQCHQVNVEATINLAKQAEQAGVKRFIFISSLKVNGESTAKNGFFNITSPKKPHGVYAQSKADAEDALNEFAENSNIEIVIIRPPLVYGPGVGGNFQRLQNLVSKGVPLPLGAINNRRSMVYVGNLCSLIERVISMPVSINNVLFVSDGNDISTTKLLGLLKVATGSRTRLLPVPEAFLEIMFKLLNKPHISERILGSLCVDISETVCTLDWKPPYTIDEAVQETVVNQKLNYRQGAE